MKSERKSLAEEKIEHAAKIWCARQSKEDLKRKLREVDSRCGKKGSPVVQGGLPSLGKHQ